MTMPPTIPAVRFHQLCVGSGDPVLFLHGLPTSCHLWDRVIESLCGHFTCIAVDLPGLGRTPPFPEGFRRLDAMAATIEALRIERGIEKWHIVGHDAGCAIGVEYAHRYSQRVGRLALLTPPSFPTSSLFLFLRSCASPSSVRSWRPPSICFSGSWLCAWLSKAPRPGWSATTQCATSMLHSMDWPARGV
jgi:pimeloyl-ACP methyl ester carboxylesterase